MAQQKVERWVQTHAHFAYEVSDLGRVRNARTRRVLKPMLTGRIRYKTPKVRLPTGDYSVSWLVLWAFVGPRKKDHQAMHRNDNPKDNRLCNLLWGTRADNQRDAARKGRCAGQVLSSEDVASIRTALEKAVWGEAKKLAVQYGVSQQRICDIRKGRTSL